jgi:hypothetical protein
MAKQARSKSKDSSGFGPAFWIGVVGSLAVTAFVVVAIIYAIDKYEKAKKENAAQPSSAPRAHPAPRE